MSSQPSLTSQPPQQVISPDSGEYIRELEMACFPTFLSAETELHRVGDSIGLELRIRYRNVNKHDICTSAKFICSHGRTPNETSGSSQRGQCPFSVMVRWKSDLAMYKIEGLDSTHNHPIVPRNRGVRGLPESIRWRMREMRAAGSSNSDILEMLRAERLPIASFADVSSITRRRQDSNTFVDEFTRFFGELDARGFIYDFDDPIVHEDVQYIRNVFFTTEEALNTFMDYPEVVLFDTTYRTNVSRKPLGAFVGIDARHRSFIIGMILFSDEKYASFDFAIKALLQKSSIDKERIKTVFTDFDRALRLSFRENLPNANLLLCRWHVKKNVMASIFKQYEMNSEEKQVAEDEFDMIAELQKEQDFEYANSGEVIDRWLQRKDGWAEAYTSKCVRLGAVSTQRVESNHSALKSHLQNVSHLNRLVEKVHAMILSRHNERLTLNRTETIRLPNSCPAALLAVYGRVTKFVWNKFISLENSRTSLPATPTLEAGKWKVYYAGNTVDLASGKSVWGILYEEVDSVIPLTSLPNCTCKKSISSLLPCEHQYSVIVLNNGVFPLDLLNKRWIINERRHRDPIIQNLEPERFTMSVDYPETANDDGGFGGYEDQVEVEDSYESRISRLRNEINRNLDEIVDLIYPAEEKLQSILDYSAMILARANPPIVASSLMMRSAQKGDHLELVELYHTMKSKFNKQVYSDICSYG